MITMTLNRVKAKGYKVLQFELVSRRHRRKPCEVSSISTYPARNLHGDATDVSRVELQRQENGYHSN
jgi:hypothetical protein